MSYQFFTCTDFGPSRGGLTTVGYRLYSQPDNALGPRVTAGVNEIVAGKFCALVELADNFIGAILWDSGEVDPLYALEVINPPVVAGGGSSGDPWSTALPGSYAAHSAGAILAKLDVGAPSSPVVVVPGAPADLSLCRVYGYFEDLENNLSDNIEVFFTVSEQGPLKSERMISGRRAVATIKAGRLTNKAGAQWIDLQRNDQLHPAGSKYLISCAALGLINYEVELNADLFDLASVVTP